MNEMSQSDRDRDHAELLMLYTTAVAEIAGFKQQQWSLTYYVLAIHAGLVAAAQLIPFLSNSDRFLLCSIVVISSAIGLFVLRTLHTSINARRTRLSNTREHFGEAFKRARSVSKEPDPVSTILAITQVVGAVIASWLIAARL
jgi:hypothetical protein